MKTQNKEMPSAQAMEYVISAARDSLKWLKELEQIWKEKRERREDGSVTRKQQRIVADAFTVYIASLFDGRSGSHSFLKSYGKDPFIEKFKKHPVVKACVTHRNNRAGHQSQKYGFVVPLDMILASDLESWLSEAHYRVCTHQLASK